MAVSLATLALIAVLGAALAEPTEGSGFWPGSEGNPALSTTLIITAGVLVILAGIAPIRAIGASCWRSVAASMGAIPIVVGGVFAISSSGNELGADSFLVILFSVFLSSTLVLGFFPPTISHLAAAIVGGAFAAIPSPDNLSDEWSLLIIPLRMIVASVATVLVFVLLDDHGDVVP